MRSRLDCRCLTQVRYSIDKDHFRNDDIITGTVRMSTHFVRHFETDALGVLRRAGFGVVCWRTWSRYIDNHRHIDISFVIALLAKS